MRAQEKLNGCSLWRGLLRFCGKGADIELLLDLLFFIRLK